MKLPSTLARDACVIIAPALRRADLDALAERGWRPVRPARALSDLAPARVAYAAVRARAEGVTIQAGDWCCAIDPVQLAADMRDVRLSAWPIDRLDPTVAERLRADTAALLAEDSDPRLRRLRLVAPSAPHWYLVGRADDALEFDVASADTLLGHVLRDHKPTGRDGPLVRRLTTELQMLCHARAGGEMSGVWPHAPGVVPTLARQVLPPLCTDNPFWRGCWNAVAPETEVKAWSDAAGIAAGWVLAPAPAAVADTIERIVASAWVRKLTVVAGDGSVSIARARWRGLLRRGRG